MRGWIRLDVRNNWLKRTGGAGRDEQGHRPLRVVLAVDEARPILSAQHEGLSENIRLNRAKGLMAMLASQSPDDYDSAADDYLENIGLPVCFKTNAQSARVLQAMFRAKVNFSALENGHCITVREQRAVEVRAF